MVQFVADGEKLFTQSTNGTIKLWEIITGEETSRRTDNVTKIVRYTLSHDGRLLALAKEDDTIEVLDLSNGDNVSTIKLKESINYDDSNIYFNLNDNLIALVKSIDATTIIWDVKTGKEASRLKILLLKKLKY